MASSQAIEAMEISTLYGLITAPDWNDDLIVRSLVACGEWAEAEAELMAPLLEASDSLWDLGAFLGTFTLGVSRFVQPREVLLLEPNPELYQHLEFNIGSNISYPSTILSAGVGVRSGWLCPKIAEDPLNRGARAYRLSDTKECNSSICYSLPDLRRRFGAYNALKIDIEGMEADVLKGDIAYLEVHHPILWVECNENGDSLHLLGLLISLGYDVKYIAFPAFRRLNYKNTQRLIYPMAYEAALVAALPERMRRFTGEAEGEDTICRPVRTADELRRALFDTPRWCRYDWTMLNRAELIARLGRMQTGDRIEDFLVATPPGIDR
jgi:FkbM family methyltransferase